MDATATLSARMPDRRSSAAETQRLLERYHRDPSPASRDALVERFLPLALHLSRRYVAGNEREDVEQVAAIGLLKAIDRFDPERGIAFTSFAVPTILGEIKRYFRDHGWAVRVPRDLQELRARLTRVTEDLTRELGRTPTTAEVASRCDTTVERVLEARALATAHRAVSLDTPADDDEREPRDRLGYEDPGYDHAEQAADVAQVLGCLSARERTIIRLRFHEELTQREIGELLGISQMQVSRLLRASIEALQSEFAPVRHSPSA
jgi:RNA polymerase sigma-B factor